MNNHFEQLNRSFLRIERWVLIFIAVIVSIALGLMGFAIWVIVKVMAFLEVI